MGIKPWRNSAKIGGEIRKRRWRGFPIYTLSLEERRTCPEKLPSLAFLHGQPDELGRPLCRRAGFEFRLERELACSISSTRTDCCEASRLGRFFQRRLRELLAHIA